MANSAFSPSVLTLPSTGGTGQGELNLVLNSSAVTDHTTGWAAVGLSASRLATGSPLDPAIPTGFRLSSSAVSQTFTTDGRVVAAGLANRKLKVEFWYKQVSGNGFKLDVSSSSSFATRYPLTTDSAGVTNIPATAGTVGKFTTYFDSDSNTPIYVRFTSLGTGVLEFTQVVVGPGIQPQGAVVGEWQSYTPTGTLTTNVTYSGRYRRVGTNAEVRVSLAFSGTNTQGEANFSPAQLLNGLGLTLDTTAVISTTNASCGTWSMLDSGLNPRYSGIVTLSSGSFMLMYPTGSGTASQVNTSVGNPIVIAAGDNIQLSVNIPIAEWAGSGTVQLAQNDCEFASVGGTWDANSSTTVYGPRGAQMGGSLTTQRNKTVTFQTPIQVTDKIDLEISPDGTAWTSLLGGVTSNGKVVSSMNNNAGALVGVAWQKTGTSQITVYFGQYSSIENDDGAGYNWGSDYWRVRKSSAGAAVGFGLADTQSSGLVRNRTSWTDLVRNDMTITATGGGTITVDAGDVTTFAWKQIDDTVTISFKLSTMSISGTVQYFTIALPASVPLAVSPASNTCIVYDNTGTANSPGSVDIVNGTRSLIIAKLGGTNFTASTNLTYVYGQITYRIA